MSHAKEEALGRKLWSSDSPLFSHSWNEDQSLVAVCPQGPDVLVLLRISSHSVASPSPHSSNPSPQFQPLCTLRKHEGQVSAVDWAHKTNRILTASHDGNAYVWDTKDPKALPAASDSGGSSEAKATTPAPSSSPCSSWVPTLVQLRSSRALLCAAWSPSEKKFAAGSVARTVSVCHFDDENGWWVGKAIRRKHESSVTGVSWHPNNVLLATTSTDFKCRIFSAHVKDVDSKPNPQEQGPGFPAAKFGEQLVELDLAMGWAFGVSWSPSGRNLAFTGHDSSIHFINNVGPDLTVHSLYPQHLPLRAVTFLSETQAVAIGFGGIPLLFQANAQGNWKYTQTLEQTGHDNDSKVSSMEAHCGQADCSPVMSIRTWPPTSSGVTSEARFTTAGLDGKMLLWHVPQGLPHTSLAQLTIHEAQAS